jgi:hypothetical protein
MRLSKCRGLFVEAVLSIQDQRVPEEFVGMAMFNHLSCLMVVGRPRGGEDAANIEGRWDVRHGAPFRPGMRRYRETAEIQLFLLTDDISRWSHTIEIQ